MEMKAEGSSTGRVRWVSEEQVRQVLTWDLLLPAVTRALSAYSRGPDHPQGAIQPLRSRIYVPQHLCQGLILTMPALLKNESLAVKILCNYPDNVTHELAQRASVIVQFQHDTGFPTAILEGKTITEMRTAAASAVATLEILKARDGVEESVVVAVLGAGDQARMHARVMAHVLNTHKMVVWARRSEAAQDLCQTLRSEGIPAVAAATVQEAVAAADVINNCTSTETPILQASWVKPGAHINSIGAIRPGDQELDEELVRGAIIYTDSYEAARKESGDIIANQATIYAEIGEVLLGTKPVLTNKVTIFKSLGLAVEDAVAAQVVCDMLKAKVEH